MVLAASAISWIALVTWIATAGAGFVLLAIWLKRGGMNQRSSGRIRPPLILAHFLLAATGLVIWIVYLAADEDALAWIAFVLLAVVALLGWTMFFIWAGQRQRRETPVEASTGTPGAGGVGAPAEQHFPVAIVAVHGLLAVTTVLLVLLAALGVGES